MSATTLTCPRTELRWWDRHGNLLRGSFAVFSIALLTLLALLLTGASWDLFVFFLVSALFFACLCFARPLSRTALAGETNSVLSGAVVIWVFLMISEAVFTHNQTTASAAGGHFDRSAFYQAASWIFSSCALAFISLFRPAYLRHLFSGPLKWPCIFGIIAVISCPLSPVPVYSLALAFKLCVIVLTLSAMGEVIQDSAGVEKLFAGLFVGTLIITIADFVAPFLGSGSVFQNGRLGMMIGLSGTCGILLLLSVLFLWLKKNPWFLFCALFSLIVMMLAGTKGGMVASFLSLFMFFVLLKRPAQALAASFGFALVLALCVAFTPLGKTLQHYTESGNATTLTGRTNLWDAVWPEIKNRPLLGHGYRASRFVSEEVEGAFAEAGNMHNSFLEVLYNNGTVGLFAIVVINVLIVVNLRSVIVRPPTLTVRYYAAGALALYIHLFLWGLVSATFGGAPDNRFMTLFAVLLISIFLRAQCDRKYRLKAYGPHAL